MVRILVAEDEPRLAAFINKGLSQQGMEVVIVSDGLEALAYLHSESCDLLLLDIGLPGANGWQVLEELQQNRNLPPVIIITARVDTFTKTQYLDAAVNSVLLKPFRFNDLLSKVQACLRGSLAGSS